MEGCLCYHNAPSLKLEYQPGELEGQSCHFICKSLVARRRKSLLMAALVLVRWNTKNLSLWYIIYTYTYIYYIIIRRINIGFVIQNNEDEKEKSIIRIQKCFRGYLARLQYYKLTEGIITLQSCKSFIYNHFTKVCCYLHNHLISQLFVAKMQEESSKNGQKCPHKHMLIKSSCGNH